MKLGLEEKIVLVTASTRGIGLAIVTSFLDEGAIVIINGRDMPRVEKLEEELRKQYGPNKVWGYGGDITETENLQNLHKFIKNQWGRIDVIVSNLGTGKALQSNKLNMSEWEHMMRINLLSAVSLIDIMLSLLERGKGANILFISSIAAYERSAAPYAYAAAKAGLLTLVKNMSFDYAKKDIRVNCVSPGNIYFDGGRWQQIYNQDKEGTKKLLEDQVPLKRFGKTEEIAAPVVFLCSEKASFITGAALVADGGQRKEI